MTSIVVLFLLLFPAGSWTPIMLKSRFAYALVPCSPHFQEHYRLVAFNGRWLNVFQCIQSFDCHVLCTYICSVLPFLRWISETRYSIIWSWKSVVSRDAWTTLLSCSWKQSLRTTINCVRKHGKDRSDPIWSLVRVIYTHRYSWQCFFRSFTAKLSAILSRS